MVNDAPSTPRDAERRLALSYAPPGARAGLEALLALDATLGGVVRTTREPMVGQMRLTWWHQALSALDTAPPPAQPVLAALADAVLPRVAGAYLAGLVDGWELLLEPIEAVDLEDYARARGGRLFTAMAAMCGAENARVAGAGEGWALADLARHLSDAAVAERARGLAIERLDAAMGGAWPRALRSLGALALSALADLARPEAPPAGPRRTARLAWHRLSGR